VKFTYLAVLIPVSHCVILCISVQTVAGSCRMQSPVVFCCGFYCTCASVRAKPDSGLHLEEAGYKYPTSCLLPTYPSSILHIMHTLAHTYRFPSSPWASTLDLYEVSALTTRVGWTSAGNNERKNALHMWIILNTIPLHSIVEAHCQSSVFSIINIYFI